MRSGMLTIMLGVTVTAMANEEDRSLCPSCPSTREIIRNYTLELYKQTILATLGLEQPPNVSGYTKPTIVPPPLKPFIGANSPEHHRHRYHTQHDEPKLYDGNDETNDSHVRSQSVLMMATARQCTKNCHKYKNNFPLVFTLDEKTAQSKLKHAKLWIHQKALKHFDSETKMEITVYKLKSSSSSSDYVQIASKQESLYNVHKWISIDVRNPLVDHFRDNQVANITLVIHGQFVGKNITGSKVPLITDIRDEVNAMVVPYLELDTENDNKPRSKRTPADMVCKEDSNQTNCCRYPLTVNFEEFKWDFVIAPTKYEANFCHGDCPYYALQKYPHTYLYQMTNSTFRPCCSPRKVSPMTMLYFDDKGNIIFGILPAMIVERCGCS